MIDVLAFGAHPDDIEVGCAGFLLKAKKQNLKTGMVVLTKGEAGRSSNPKTRETETENAAEILRVDYLNILGFKDSEVEFNTKNAIKITMEIAAVRPKILLAPWHDDHHPDHTALYQLVRKAAHLSILEKYNKENIPGPKQIFYYPLNLRKIITPDFVLDITDVAKTKETAISVHKSQHEVIKGTDILGKAYSGITDSAKGKVSEGFISEFPIILENLDSLF